MTYLCARLGTAFIAALTLFGWVLYRADRNAAHVLSEQQNVTEANIQNAALSRMNAAASTAPQTDDETAGRQGRPVMKKENPIWLYVPCALLLACGFALLGGCSEVRIRQECLNLRTPTVEQQQGSYAEMVAHPELTNIRIQAADLDYALRENAACRGKSRP